MMDLSELSGYPLLGLNLWEHAFYLDYQNRKADYVDAYCNIIDWGEAADRYETPFLFNNSYDKSQKKVK